MTADDRSVIVFVKAPERGMVKSRLAAEIGYESARALYMCFVQDTFTMLTRNKYPFTVFFHPARSREMVTRWLATDSEMLPQHGGDLGEKMKNAFNDIFQQGTRRAVLIGSDIPDLPGSIIGKAFASLNDNNAVVGPSYDGGYYLIGFRSDSFLPNVFGGISWSTPAVLDQTLSIFRGSGHRVYILSKGRDIDTCDDLRDFFKNNPSASSGAPATFEYIRSHPEVFPGRK